jgi:TRAP-type C4-dicarboxylate transport system permease small subunit
MGLLSKRKSEEPDRTPPATPETLIGLLNAASDNWGKTLRLIALVSCLLICAGLAVGGGVAIVLVALKGIGAIVPKYAVPTGIFSGATVLVALAGAVTAFLKKMKIKRQASVGTDDTQPGKH